jgi:hypothetical protein
MTLDLHEKSLSIFEVPAFFGFWKDVAKSFDCSIINFDDSKITRQRTEWISAQLGVYGAFLERIKS